MRLRRPAVALLLVSLAACGDKPEPADDGMVVAEESSSDGGSSSGADASTSEGISSTGAPVEGVTLVLGELGRDCSSSAGTYPYELRVQRVCAGEETFDVDCDPAVAAGDSILVALSCEETHAPPPVVIDVPGWWLVEMVEIRPTGEWRHCYQGDDGLSTATAVAITQEQIDAREERRLENPQSIGNDYTCKDACNGNGDFMICL